MHDDLESPLRRYLRFLKRQGWLIAMVFILSLTTAALVTFTQAKVYRASMKMVVAQTGGDQQTELGSDELAQTMATLLESDVVARGVSRNLRLDVEPRDLLKHLDVTFRPNSAVLNVHYDSNSRRQALNRLRAFFSVFEQRVDDVLGVRAGRGSLRGSSPLPVIAVDVFDPPHLEEDPVSPKPAQTLGFAGALGLALGLVLAFARESLDDRIRGHRQAEEWFGAPVVGSLPKGARGKPPPSVKHAGSRSHAVVDASALLRASVQFSRKGMHGPTILVTSALMSEGKTTVAANLATGLAMGGKSVICVEADMRRPTLHRVLGITPPPSGLADVLAGDAEIEEVLKPVSLIDPRIDGRVSGKRASLGNGAPPSERQREAARLLVLPTGQLHADPGELLSAESVTSLIESLRSRADYVIFDSPPLLMIPDSFPLAIHSDNVLVVARRGRTTKEKAEAVKATLQGLGVKNIGVVLTDAPVRDGYYYG